MDTEPPRADPEGPRLRLIEQVLSLIELCEHLQVSAQTIYDLRSQGRGPRGFRVVTGAALATVSWLPVLLLPSDVFATRVSASPARS